MSLKACVWFVYVCNGHVMGSSGGLCDEPRDLVQSQLGKKKEKGKKEKKKKKKRKEVENQPASRSLEIEAPFFLNIPPH